MKIPTKNKDWIKIMGLGLSLPSLIFFLGWLMKVSVDAGYVSKPVGLIVFLAVISNTFYLMVRYAINKKNKS